MKGKNVRISAYRGGRLVLAATLMLILFSLPALAETPMPKIAPAVKGDQCVEDTDYMRKNHMDLLTHHRDHVVHQGVRTKKYSLKECLVCHAVKGEDNQAVTAQDPRHFCSACHSYAAVKVDCFQCHASTPDEAEPVRLGKAAPLGMKITDLRDMNP